MKVRLIPNTGIQYFTLPDLKVAELKKFTHSVEVVVPAAGASGSRLPDVRAVDRSSSEDDFYGDEGGGGFEARQANPRLLLELAATFNGVWIPLPFDRGGPWVSIHLKPGSSPDSLRAALAVDTTLEGHGNPHGIEVEVGDRELLPASRMFWRRRAVFEALKAIVARTERRPNPPPKIDVPELQLSIIGLAGYLREAFDDRQGLSVVFAPRPERGKGVKVDVVLDLGNSRTCALLLEDQPLTRQERLELVYPDDPFTPHKCPFETQFALVDHEVMPSTEEPCESFRFISLVKMGPPAGSLLRSLAGDPQPVGMSSPKRYLWETQEPVQWEWRRADFFGSDRRPPVIHGLVLRHMNPARPLAAPDSPELPVAPNYPRQACAVWCILELLEQSFRQANSSQWRRAAAHAPMADLRREIGSLVIMYPAGMHSEEIRNYRAACETACKLWTAFRSDPQRFAEGDPVEPDEMHGVQRPRVQVVCDEALAIQLCWLHGELLHRHLRDLGGFFRHVGRPRGETPVDTLRVASLDIGGGTIDLAIADYTQDTTRPADVAIEFQRLFHDGISRAGDEVVRSVLEEIVFPSIAEQCGIPTDRWNEALARPVADELMPLRRLLVRNVWIPIAIRCLEQSELQETFELRIGDIEPRIDDLKLTELQRRLGIPAKGPAIRDVTLRIDRRKMASIIRKSIGRTIMQCADIVDQYRCDVLIVGGRPSSNPAIRQHILSSMAVPPGQVVFLSETKAGDWYPFVCSGGRIGDAKTCGVFGAAIAFRAMYGFSNFRLTPHPTREPDGIIGFLRHPDPRKPIEFDAGSELRLDEGHEIRITPEIGADAGLNLAIRRIASPAAEAKPIYQVRLKTRYKKLLERNPVHQDPVSVTLEYDPEPAIRTNIEVGKQILLPIGTTRDRVKIRSVVGDISLAEGRREPAERAFEITLKTLLEGDGYWIDTGQFGELRTGETS